MENGIKCHYCRHINEDLPLADHLDFWVCLNCGKEFAYYPVTIFKTMDIDDYNAEGKIVDDLLKEYEKECELIKAKNNKIEVEE